MRLTKDAFREKLDQTCAPKTSSHATSRDAQKNHVHKRAPSTRRRLADSLAHLTLALHSYLMNHANVVSLGANATLLTTCPFSVRFRTARAQLSGNA